MNLRHTLTAVIGSLILFATTSCETGNKKPKLKMPGDDLDKKAWNIPAGWEGSSGFGMMPQGR